MSRPKCCGFPSFDGLDAAHPQILFPNNLPCLDQRQQLQIDRLNPAVDTARSKVCPCPCPPWPRPSLRTGGKGLVRGLGVGCHADHGSLVAGCRPQPAVATAAATVTVTAATVALSLSPRCSRRRSHCRPLSRHTCTASPSPPPPPRPPPTAARHIHPHAAAAAAAARRQPARRPARRGTQLLSTRLRPLHCSFAPHPEATLCTARPARV